MSLRQALAQTDFHLARLKLKELEPLELKKAIRLIVSDVEIAPQSLDIAQLQNSVRAEFEANKLIELPLKNLKQVPYGFFDGPKAFSEDDELSLALLSEIARRSKRSIIRMMIYQYLEYFDPKKARTSRLGGWLDEQVTRWDWQWRTSKKKFDLFNPQVGPQKIAQFLMTSQVSIMEMIDEVGLSRGSLTSGVGSAAFECACDLTASVTGNALISAQNRLIAWANCTSEGYLFEAQLPSFVEALLSPWETNEPDTNHKNRLLSVLEEIGGDPRVKPARWQRVKEDMPRVYAQWLKWLTKASVYQFFDIIDDMIPADQRHMWAYRRPFWTSFLEAGHIDEAWVVFGANGIARARKLIKDTQGNALSSFGKLSRPSRGKTHDHAALILKIGDLIISEWSHSGAFQVWDIKSKSAPRLYRLGYEADDLMDGDESGTHGGSENYSWQYKLHELVRRKTGRTVSSNHWRPSRY